MHGNWAALAALTLFGTAAQAQSPAPSPAVTIARAPSDALQCRTYTFGVRQYPTDVIRQPVWGQLCFRGRLTAATPVQVLVHGGAYNHLYWDSPFQPDRYSYVRAATARGYATLNFDRLGYGQSAHPLPVTLDFNVAGYVTHQLVQVLRDGTLGVRFTRVILNGHSMGAMAAQNEAANYGDVDALIVSGIGHDFDLSPDKTTIFSPAALDPKFAGQPALVGYLTSSANGRAAAFLANGTYDPAIVPVEEGPEKDTLSPTELTSLTLDTSDASDVTRRIRVPVLFVQGRYDKLWCSRTGDCTTDSYSLNEASYWDPSVSFTRVLIPDAGHSINGNLSAPTFFETTFTWLRQHGFAPQ